MSTEKPSLSDGVERLIGAATEFGVALARAADKTTAGGREPRHGPEGETDAAAIIRHSVSAAANVVSQVAAATQAARADWAETRSEAKPSSAETQEQGDGPSGPRVRPGATLRVPLSIENPGQEPMTGLTPKIAGWMRDGVEGDPAGTVSFAPEVLEIAPRDFEKLTVFVEIPKDADSGECRLLVDLAEGVEVRIDFAILPPEPAQDVTAP